MASKAFLRLTVSEAIVIARQIVSSSKSAREIKRRLTEAGFSGKATVINLYSRGSRFRAIVIVRGPKGETIRVESRT